ncbi:MAG: hypothetical protein ABSH16_02600 [Sedimentisphaerales bacterium]
MNNMNPNTTGMTKPPRSDLRVLSGAVILSLNIVGIGYSLWCSLFGPHNGVLIGVLGFVIGIFSIILISRNFTRGSPGSFQPLSERFEFLLLFRPTAGYITKAVGLLAVLGIIVLFASARLDGVGSYPVFEKLPEYVLVDHGTKTDVSRLRYIFVGTGFFVGWHCFTMLVSISGLRCLLFGERVLWMESCPKKDNNK